MRVHLARGQVGKGVGPCLDAGLILTRFLEDASGSHRRLRWLCEKRSVDGGFAALATRRQRRAKSGRELVRQVGQLQPRQPRLHNLVVTDQFDQNAHPPRRVLALQENFKIFGRLGWLGRGGESQSDGMPWLRSQNVPCQFETYPSVQQATQRQKTVSS